MDNESVGKFDISCSLKDIISVSGSLVSVEISHVGGTFKFFPGMTRVNGIVSQIEKQKQ